MTVTVATSCTACGSCLVTCPAGALRAAPRRPAVVDDRCTDCLACLEVCPVDAIGPRPNEAIHPIEMESYRILYGRVNLDAWPPGQRDVVARMIHATADESFATTIRIGGAAVAAAVTAVRSGAAVVCDSNMVVAGIPAVARATCFLDQVPAAASGDTRSAAAIRAGAERHPVGAVWVIGNAPTALRQLLRLHAGGLVAPAAVIGVPVGYVGAAEAKAALWDSRLQAVTITNTGERGGSPAAAAALNAINRLARPRGGPR
ncbi:MAG TPA: precorrin-8X methylmutase [Acidimicrobiales bacterium]